MDRQQWKASICAGRVLEWRLTVPRAPVFGHVSATCACMVPRAPIPGAGLRRGRLPLAMGDPSATDALVTTDDGSSQRTARPALNPGAGLQPGHAGRNCVYEHGSQSRDSAGARHRGSRPGTGVTWARCAFLLQFEPGEGTTRASATSFCRR